MWIVFLFNLIESKINLIFDMVLLSKKKHLQLLVKKRIEHKWNYTQERHLFNFFCHLCDCHLSFSKEKEKKNAQSAYNLNPLFGLKLPKKIHASMNVAWLKSWQLKWFANLYYHNCLHSEEKTAHVERFELLPLVYDWRKNVSEWPRFFHVVIFKKRRKE